MMTQEYFQKLWTLNFPYALPISHLFKYDYSDRWFRIHSLPESKRYADNEDEWKILLSRQNEVISDLFGINTPVLLITGEYNWGNQRTTHITDEEEIFQDYSFRLLDSIDLYKIDSEQYDKVDIYRPAFAQTIWKPNHHNKILKEIADDSTRAFFVSFEKQVIVAPYDGGIDFVLKDSLVKEKYKSKYGDWLSKRDDEL